MSRLRLLLLVVGLVTVTACVIGFAQLREISIAYQALTQGALPVMIQTQAVERNHNDMFVSLERATVAATTSELKAAKNDLRQGIARFRTRVMEVDRARGASDLTQRLLSRLDQLETAADQALRQRHTLLVKETQLNALEDDLTAIQTAARDALESLNLATTLRIEALLAQARSGKVPPADMIDQLFSELFLTSLNLNSFSTDIETVIDLARSDQSIQTADAFRVLAAALRNKLQRMAALLLRLAPSPQRTELASLNMRLSTLLLGSEGLIESGEARLLHHEKLRALRQARIEMAQDMSQLVTQLSVQSTISVAEKSRLLEDTVQFLTVILAVSLFVATTTTLVGNSIIIEKQINRRMGRLEKAAKAIADGDLEHPVDVAGQDELGDIARALTIFKQNAEELRRSNIELERFAYVAAHDLRSPLRAMQDLAEWTMEDDGNALSTDSRAYLEMMQNRANRLDRLLTDLLDYARAGKESDGLAEMDLAQTIGQISAMLDPANSFDIRYAGTELTIRTHATPLHQILINLISNAIKHHDRDSGQISVSAEVISDRVFIEVRDDGPGIPKEYQQRVFQLFQTLRPRDEVEGSGLGLAIIRKLLDRYSGSIVLESNPGSTRGACFRFDFPVAEHVAQSDHPHADAA